MMSTPLKIEVRRVRQSRLTAVFASVLSSTLAMACDPPRDSVAEREAMLYSAEAEKAEARARRSEDELTMVELRNLRETRDALQHNVAGLKNGSIVPVGPDDLADYERRLAETGQVLAAKLTQAKERRAKLAELKKETEAELARQTGRDRVVRGTLEDRLTGIDASAKALDVEIAAAER